MWDWDARTFVQTLREYREQRVCVCINSPGGDVMAGIAMYNQLKRHPGGCDVFVDGIAASAASLVAMAGSSILMGTGTQMMIHDPWTFGVGNADDMLDAAKALIRTRDTMVDIYQARTGIDRDRLIEMLADETWLDGAACVHLGFADQVESSKAIAASMSGKNLMINGVMFRADKFNKLPAALHASAKAASAAQEPNVEEIDKLKAQLAAKVAELAKALAECDAKDAELGEMRRSALSSEADEFLASHAAKVAPRTRLYAHLHAHYCAHGAEAVSDLLSDISATSTPAAVAAAPQSGKLTDAATAAPAGKPRAKLAHGDDGAIDWVKTYEGMPDDVKARVRALSARSSSPMLPADVLRGMHRAGTLNKTLQAAGYEPVEA